MVVNQIAKLLWFAGSSKQVIALLQHSFTEPAQTLLNICNQQTLGATRFLSEFICFLQWVKQRNYSDNLYIDLCRNKYVQYNFKIQET